MNPDYRISSHARQVAEATYLGHVQSRTVESHHAADDDGHDADAALACNGLAAE